MTKQKAKMWPFSKTQIVKTQSSYCDKTNYSETQTQKLKVLQNSRLWKLKELKIVIFIQTQIVKKKLRKSNKKKTKIKPGWNLAFEKWNNTTQKLKFWHKQKNQIVTKLFKSISDNTEKKMLTNQFLAIL